MTDWNKWLKKRELCADNILYVYRRAYAAISYEDILTYRIRLTKFFLLISSFSFPVSFYCPSLSIYCTFICGMLEYKIGCFMHHHSQ